MFNGMYDLMNKLKKKPISEKVALQKNATPILSPEDLLSSERRQQVLTDIRTLLNLPDEEYNKIFLSVLHQFAEFVQNLPETERSFYASLGGLLDHALERASLSLFLARTYLLPEGTTLSSVSEEEMLWVYAIFTASLLLDVGKVPTRHVVSLTDAAGNVIEAWHPYAGSMKIKESGTHYVFGFMDEHNDHLRWQVTPLLARQIISVEGFNWLASNEEVLQAWLGLLSDDQSEMGWLKVIPLADAQILESYFTDRKVFRHSLSQTIALLEKIKKDRKEALKRLKELTERGDNKEKKDESKWNKEGFLDEMTLLQIAKEAREGKITPKEADKVVGQFINWLNHTHEKVKAGQSNVEIHHVTGAAEGILISKDIIDKFVSENKLQHLTSELVEKILQQQEFANPWQVARVTGHMAPALVAANTSLAFAQGMPISLDYKTFPLNSVVETKSPTETKEAEQKEAQRPGSAYVLSPKKT